MIQIGVGIQSVTTGLPLLDVSGIVYFRPPCGAIKALGPNLEGVLSMVGRKDVSASSTTINGVFVATRLIANQRCQPE